MNNTIAGFSKLSKEEKINWIANNYFSTPSEAIDLLKNTGILTVFYSNYTTNSLKILSLTFIFLLSCSKFLINGKIAQYQWLLKKVPLWQQQQNQPNFGQQEVDSKATIINTEKSAKFILYSKEIKAKLKVFQPNKNNFFSDTDALTKI